jgi:hypothetical protein
MKHIIRTVAENFLLIFILRWSMREGAPGHIMKLPPILILLLLLAAGGLSRAQILNGSFETPVINSVNVLGLGLVPGLNIYTAGGNPTGITD